VTLTFSATWTRDGKTVKASKRIEIKTTEKHSIIMILDAERADSGLYKLTVENKLGTDTVEFQISVIGTTPSFMLYNEINE